MKSNKSTELSVNLTEQFNP